MTPTQAWLLHLTFAMTTFNFLVMFTYFIFAVIQPDAAGVLEGLR
jgi:hypothetical protein